MSAREECITPGCDGRCGMRRAHPAPPAEALSLSLPEGVRVCHVEAEATSGDTVCLNVVLRLSGPRAGQGRKVATALDAIIRAEVAASCECGAGVPPEAFDAREIADAAP